MRAVIQPTPTSPSSALTLTTDNPIPTANHTPIEHLIRVHACSPCANELKWSTYVDLPASRALIPCPDFAGTVVTAPPDSPFQPGDAVYARTNYLRPGNARDYTIALINELARKPASLSWVEAAAVPVSALTAWQILFVQAGVVVGLEVGLEAARAQWSGKRVLVTAAAGGVGLWVVQLARLLGAEVIGTCGNAESEALVRALGAGEVLNYRTTDFRRWAEDDTNRVDVVVDNVGGSALRDAWWTVRDGGVMVSIVQQPGPGRPQECSAKNVREVFFIMSPDGEQLQQITELIEEGKCRPRVDSVWPLEHAREAFARLDGGHARGKIVLDLSLNQ